MSRSVETLYRQWMMLSKIPRFPRKISAPELKSIISGEGYEVTIRTIQRDLEKLSTHFPLNFDTEGRTYYWFWIEHATAFDLPGMEPVTALAFQMAESYLLPLLPQSTLDLLIPYFKRAKEVLEATTKQSHLSAWPNKVAVLGRGPVLKSPNILPEVQQNIYQALLEAKQLSASYRSRGADDATEYTVHPLGIVSRQASIYLVCTLWHYPDIKQLALHRFETALKVDTPCNIPDGFDLSVYTREQQHFAYPLSDERISIKVCFEADVAEHLYETPLSEEQQLTLQHDDRVLLEATVQDTWELRWWLQGFGGNVEILEPAALRQYFVDITQKLGSLYLT